MTLSDIVPGCLGKIHYQEGDRWLPIPQWAGFLVLLARSVAGRNPDDVDCVAAISVPTRSYAAAFLGIGAVLGRIGSESAETPYADYAELLEKLPVGTPVWLRSGGKRLKGTLEGPRRHSGVLYLGVRVETATTRYIPAEECGAIEVRETGFDTLPGHQSGHSIDDCHKFLAGLLPSPHADALVRKSHAECIFIARVGTLSGEFRPQILGVRDESGGITLGSFQNIIRARQFMCQGEAWRSAIIPLSTTQEHLGMQMRQGGVVVFDGALGYLKWRDSCRGRSWLVVLDRTDRNWADAVEALNGDYIQRRSAPRMILPVPAVPTGMQVMVYGVRR